MDTVTIILFLLCLMNATSYPLNRREVPKQFAEVEIKTVQESYECGKQMGQRVLSLKTPNTHGIFEETNGATNELWGCVWSRLNLINEDSTLNEENLENYFLENMRATAHNTTMTNSSMKFIVQECKHLKGENYGATAIKMHNCIQRFLNTYLFLEKNYLIVHSWNKS
ncbi:hypothetical protein RI129_002421 [Pyrocoelia pectoralis]|uniref:Uncharacterized protein n=1 Tax=Pyrocoelia pectoralis TaxID=417401 RepID=A0AAN7VIX3_9COLE